MAIAPVRVDNMFISYVVMKLSHVRRFGLQTSIVIDHAISGAAKSFCSES